MHVGPLRGTLIFYFRQIIAWPLISIQSDKEKEISVEVTLEWNPESDCEALIKVPPVSTFYKL